jgi:hypothetical protein
LVKTTTKSSLSAHDHTVSFDYQQLSQDAAARIVVNDDQLELPDP